MFAYGDEVCFGEIEALPLAACVQKRNDERMKLLIVVEEVIIMFRILILVSLRLQLRILYCSLWVAALERNLFFRFTFTGQTYQMNMRREFELVDDSDDIDDNNNHDHVVRLIIGISHNNSHSNGWNGVPLYFDWLWISCVHCFPVHIAHRFIGILFIFIILLPVVLYDSRITTLPFMLWFELLYYRKFRYYYIMVILNIHKNWNKSIHIHDCNRKIHKIQKIRVVLSMSNIMSTYTFFL